MLNNISKLFIFLVHLLHVKLYEDIVILNSTLFTGICEAWTRKEILCTELRNLLKTMEIAGNLKIFGETLGNLGKFYILQ